MELFREEWQPLDSDEVSELIQAWYGGATAAGDTPNVVFVPSPGEQCAVELHYADDSDSPRITTIRSGSSFDADKWNACAGRVEECALRPSPEWWQATVFQQYPVEGSWQSHTTDLRLHPAPAEWPRAHERSGFHPFLLQFRAVGSPDATIVSWRLKRALMRRVKLLNLLVQGSSFVYPPGPGQWVVTEGSEVPVWASRRYLDPVIKPTAEPDDAAPEKLMKVVQADRYYPASAEQVGMFTPHPLEVPDNLDASLAAYENLGDEARTRFDLAVHWAYVGDASQNTSASVFFQSMCTAIECLAADNVRKKCNCCPDCPQNDDRATRRFMEFLRQFGGVEGARAGDIYRVRSSLTHGRRLLRTEDHSRAFLGFVGSRQDELRWSLLLGVTRGLRNWLLAGGPILQV